MKTFELLYFLVTAACKFSLEGSFLIFRIGTFFSPIMPGMGAVKFFILFYVKLVRNHLFGHKATRAHLSQRHRHTALYSAHHLYFFYEVHWFPRIVP